MGFNNFYRARCLVIAAIIPPWPFFSNLNLIGKGAENCFDQVGAKKGAISKAM